MKKVLSFFSALAIIVAGVIPVNYMISATEDNSTDSKVQIIAEDITVDKDDEVFTLLDEVSATDENGEEVEVTVLDDGDFDVTTIGEYTVTYQAIDPSDESEVTKERLVTVEEPEVVVEETIEKENTTTNAEETPVKKSLLRAGPVTVNNVSDLVSAVNSASEGDVITLGDSFPAGNVTITIPTVNVVIDGNNQVYTSGTISTTGGNSGSITIRNLKFETASSRAFAIGGTGKVILDNISMTGRSAGDGGGAIYVGSSANLSITNCSLIGNSNVGYGYGGGAISATDFTGTMIISNTKFINNQTTQLGSVYGGEGGAIGILRTTTGKINIKNCYFEGNTAATNQTSGNLLLADGGAISVFNISQGAEFTIDSSTFYKNEAGDDGGAILIQSNGTVTSGVSISNSTFYQNIAHGRDFTVYNGGAIQLYTNGTLKSFRVQMNNNSFVENDAAYGGGAVAGSGGTLSSSGGVYTNNLFVGNTAGNGNAATNNVYQAITSSVNLGGNVGYDNNSATSTATMESVFGKYSLTFGSNYSSVTAGSSYDVITIPTLSVKPQGDADEVSGASTYTTDQRGYSRIGATTDAGAVESSWIKYDANGGSFSLTELTTYDGTKYYEDSTPTVYYDMSVIGGTDTIQSKTSLTVTAPTDKEFLGWSKDKNATVADPTYDPGKSVTYLEDNLILYAIYGDKAPETYNVTYNGNESDGGTVPTDPTDYLFDEDVTVEGQGTMTREGYKFTGWNTDAGGNGTSYEPTDTFKIKGDTTLYAQWEELYNVTFDSQGGSSVASQNNKEAGSKVTEPTAPTREGYEFAGWHNEAGCTSTWDFDNDTITGHKILYAKWTEVKVLYTVTFDSQGGSSVSSQTGLASGSKVVEPSDPTREGYEFAGWYTDAKCTTAWDFSNDTITGNMTLYADWNKNKDEKELYTVDFDSQGGSSVDSQTGMSIGDKVTEPAIPTREGYYFDGWYSEAECVTAWNFEDDTISGNMTLYAKWTKEIIVDPTKPTDPKPSVKPEEKPSTQPETGDSTNLTSLLALLGLSSLTVLVAISRKKLFKK